MGEVPLWNGDGVNTRKVLASMKGGHGRGEKVIFTVPPSYERATPAQVVKPIVRVAITKFRTFTRTLALMSGHNLRGLHIQRAIFLLTTPCRSNISFFLAVRSRFPSLAMVSNLTPQRSWAGLRALRYGA